MTLAGRDCVSQIIIISAAPIPLNAALFEFCCILDFDDITHLDGNPLQPAGAGCDAKIEARNKSADRHVYGHTVCRERQK